MLAAIPLGLKVGAGLLGAGLTPFFPVTGQAIGAVGSLTGI